MNIESGNDIKFTYCTSHEIWKLKSK